MPESLYNVQHSPHRISQLRCFSARIKPARDQSHTAVEDQGTQLERIETGIESLEARLSDNAAEAGLLVDMAGLRSDIVEVRTGVQAAAQVGPNELASQMLRIFRDWLAAYSSDG